MNKERINRLIWIIIILFAITSILVGVAGEGPLMFIAPFIAVTTLALFSFIHGSKNFGLKRMLVFFGITFVISWSMETSSIMTGFPFGNYYYTDILGFKIGLVPFLIMPAYFGTIYSSWMMANMLLDKFNKVYRKGILHAEPIVAMFIMAMWDYCIDPHKATVAKSWIWEDGGSYFGVPFVNFLGWLLTVFLIFQVWTIYLNKSNKNYPNDHLEVLSKSNWLQPTLMYGAIALEMLILPFTLSNSEIVDPSGQVWNLTNIYETLALSTIFTMVFVVVLSIFKITKSKKLV